MRSCLFMDRNCRRTRLQRLFSALCGAPPTALMQVIGTIPSQIPSARGISLPCATNPAITREITGNETPAFLARLPKLQAVRRLAIQGITCGRIKAAIPSFETEVDSLITAPLDSR